MYTHLLDNQINPGFILLVLNFELYLHTFPANNNHWTVEQYNKNTERTDFNRWFELARQFIMSAQL